MYNLLFVNCRGVNKETKLPWLGIGLFKWRNGLRELAIVGSLYVSFRLASGAVAHRDGLAFQNAYDIVGLERFLGLFVEKDFQSFFLASTFLIDLVNVLYTIFYYPAVIIFGIWAYNRHREQYSIVRNVLFVSAGIAFLSFALYPVAPPRMLSELGFIDTMAQYSTVDYASSGARVLTNPYAAMPSLHFGWPLLVGIATICIATTWWLRLLGALVPLCMLVAIIATGNHFILDAIGGALVIGLAYGLVVLFDRLRQRGSLWPWKTCTAKR